MLSLIHISEIAAGKKVMAFGDFSYYWIADRQGRSFKRLNELFAATGQVGFLASQRVDGKLLSLIHIYAGIPLCRRLMKSW